MRVLEINKFLYHGNGANTVMFNSGELLANAGHEVAYFAMDDPRNVEHLSPVGLAPRRSYDRGGSPVRRVIDGAAAVYSLPARRALREFVARWRPDVAHIHSIYHQLTLSIVDELVAQRIPIVMSVHDYKIACPNIMLYTHDRECHACVTRTLPLPAVRNRCIRGSLGGSALAAVETTVARLRHTYQRIDRLIAPSRYLADVIVAAGIDTRRVTHIPHFVPDAAFREPGEHRWPQAEEPRFFFMGRLEPSKGIATLLAAAPRLTRGQLVIAGEGNLLDQVRAQQGPHLQYAGFLGPAQLREQIDAATALLVPSLWPEPFGMVVLEAGARGLPVISARVGGLAELVDDHRDGLVHAPGDVDGLVAALNELAQSPQLASDLGRGRYARVQRENSAAVHLPLLEAQLEAAVSRRPVGA